MTAMQPIPLTRGPPVIGGNRCITVEHLSSGQFRLGAVTHASQSRVSSGRKQSRLVDSSDDRCRFVTDPLTGEAYVAAAE